MKKVLTTLALASVLAASPVLNAITHAYLPGVLHETTAFASFNTTGAEMAGMGVHVVYADGSTYDTSWQKFSTGFGGVNNSDFFIQAGNTGTTANNWTLYNPTTRAIRSVSLDGQPGNTVFDVSFPFGEFRGFNYVGTTGTSSGREFALGSLYGIYNGTAITYSDAVSLQGTDAVGDVFRRMTIDFASDRLFGSGALLEFGQDTDSLAFGSVLAPVTPVGVPEGGATASMLCVGLLSLAACARRRVVTQRANG